jgi:hypothetical protein
MLKRMTLITLLVLVAGACSGAPVGVTQQPGTTQQPGSTPGATLPPGGTANTCTLVTADEMSAIWGVAMTSVSDDAGACTWTAATGLPSVSTRFEATDLATAKQLLGADADVTVAGRPGVIGTLFGVILYVQAGATAFVVQTVLTEDTPENRQKVIQVAERAFSRLQ